MNEKFLEFRTNYPKFIYEKYEINDKDLNLEIIYHYNIPSLETFENKIIIPKDVIQRKDIDYKFLEKIVFHLGIVEAINYFKCTCSPNLIINCGYLNKEQVSWYKKLYYNGLGEFLYRNNIDIGINDFVNILIYNNTDEYQKINFESNGNLINVGGGKDSCVSLELLKNEPNNACFLMNAKKPMIECAHIAGFLDNDIYCIERIIDKDKLIHLNSLGYLNGHVPISSVIAFLSYLIAYLSGKKNIILSNESSANESYVKGKNINHQYSKSYEFERDFYKFTTTYFSDSIKYFSFLRPLNELQITYIFSKLKKYHLAFKSCNLGSKNDTWNWCLNCSKCLFAYLLLNTFLTEVDMLNIFGENLLDKKSLLDDFIGLIGDSISKPFECVGTYDEVNYCVNKSIEKYLNNNQNLPFLLKYYYDKYGVKTVDDSLLHNYNNENNLDLEYSKLIKEEIKYE